MSNTFGQLTTLSIIQILLGLKGEFKVLASSNSISIVISQLNTPFRDSFRSPIKLQGTTVWIIVGNQ